MTNIEILLDKINTAANKRDEILALKKKQEKESYDNYMRQLNSKAIQKRVKNVITLLNTLKKRKFYIEHYRGLFETLGEFAYKEHEDKFNCHYYKDDSIEYIVIKLDDDVNYSVVLNGEGYIVFGYFKQKELNYRIGKYTYELSEGVNKRPTSDTVFKAIQKLDKIEERLIETIESL